MIVYNLTSFVGGISDFTDKGIAGSGKWSSGLEIRSGADELVCKQALVQESAGVFEDLILWFVPAPDGYVYGFGDRGRIYRRSGSGVWTKVYTDSYGKILGACLGYRYVSAGNYQAVLYWATSTRLNRKPIPGSTDWSDVNATDSYSSTSQTYPKTNLSPSTWHTMKMCNQGVWIGNGNLLGLVAIEDGSYTNEASEAPLPPSLEITTLTNRGALELSAGCSSVKVDAQAELYSFDTAVTSELIAGDVDTISNLTMAFKTVDTAVDGEFYLMVADGRLWYTDQYSKQPVCSLPFGATCVPGGSTLRDNVALFAVSGAMRESGDESVDATGIYAYGRNKNADTPVLNLEYPMEADALGGLLNFIDDNGNQILLVAAQSENTYRVMTISQNQKQIGEYESLELQNPYVAFPKRQKIENLVIKSAPIPEGSKVEVWYRTDLAGAWQQAYFADNMENQDSDHEFTSGTEATWNIGENANYFEVKVRLTPAGNESPRVKDIYIEVDEENL